MLGSWFSLRFDVCLASSLMLATAASSFWARLSNIASCVGSRFSMIALASFELSQIDSISSGVLS